MLSCDTPLCDKDEKTTIILLLIISTVNDERWPAMQLKPGAYKRCLTYWRPISAWVGSGEVSQDTSQHHGAVYLVARSFIVDAAKYAFTACARHLGKVPRSPQQRLFCKPCECKCFNILGAYIELVRYRDPCLRNEFAQSIA